MSTYDICRNMITGISQGSFARIYVKNIDGQMVDIMTLLGSAGGITEVTGGGIVSIVASAGARQVVVDLASYSTTAQMNTIFGTYSTTTQMNSIFDTHSTTSQMNAAIVNAIVGYATTSQVATDLSGKISTSHESNKIGTADVDFGAFGVLTRKIIFDSTIGPICWLENDDTGKLQLGGINDASGGVVTMPILDANLALYTTTTLLTPLLAGKVDSADLVSYAASVTQALVDKEDVLNFYSEVVGTTTTIIQTYVTSSISLHLSWTSGVYSNVSGSHQVVDTGCWHTLNNIGVGETHVVLDLRAGTADHIVLATNDTTSWTPYEAIRLELTSSFQTFYWTFNSTGASSNFHVGVIPTGSSLTQTSGNFHMRNLRIYRTTAASTISEKLVCAENLVCSKSASATNFISTSDSSIKENQTDVSTSECMELLRAVIPQTYHRTDIGMERLGFIAQHVQNAAPANWNLTAMQYNNGQALLGLDYSRLTAVLWQVCRSLEGRIIALEDA